MEEEQQHQQQLEEEESQHREEEDQQQEDEEKPTTIEAIEYQIKQHLDKVAELKELLKIKRKKDDTTDKPTLRIEAIEPESTTESLNSTDDGCALKTDLEIQNDRPVVNEFNTTVDTCVMVDYNQKLFEGWLGVEENKRVTHSRGKWMFLWATLDCKQLVLKPDPAADNVDMYKIIDLGRIVCMHQLHPKSFGLEEERMSQVIQIKYYDDPYYANTSVSNTSIYSENPPNWSGHDFQDVTFRMPKKCNYCMGKLNSILSPPVAYECSKCHLKIHQEHANEPDLTNCSVPARVKVIKLMAPNETKWGNWVKKLDDFLQSKKELTSSSNKSSCPLTHDSTLMD